MSDVAKPLRVLQFETTPMVMYRNFDCLVRLIKYIKFRYLDTLLCEFIRCKNIFQIDLLKFFLR